MSWYDVCAVDDIRAEDGVVALVGNEQVALLRTADGAVYAVDQRDPFSGAYVMARGIVGSRGEAPTLATPMYKQVFDLRTGTCLDTAGAEERHLRVWPTRVEAGRVLVRTPALEEAS